MRILGEKEKIFPVIFLNLINKLTSAYLFESLIFFQIRFLLQLTLIGKNLSMADSLN